MTYIAAAALGLCQRPGCLSRPQPRPGLSRCGTCGEWACGEHGPQHSVGWRAPVAA